MKYDAIILGGGLAGLAAANRLAKNGARVIVLEARDRAGGRVCTCFEANSPGPIENGAKFVHGSVPELDEAIRQSGVTVQDVVDQHHLFVDGTLRSLDFDAVWQPFSVRLNACA